MPDTQVWHDRHCRDDRCSYGCNCPCHRGVLMENDASEGHLLARGIIARHGVDRYPTAALNAAKVLDEAVELLQEVLADFDATRRCGLSVPGNGKIAKEFGDTGLSLYALGDKLGLDLIGCMRMVVDSETRRFAAADEHTRLSQEIEQARPRSCPTCNSIGIPLKVLNGGTEWCKDPWHA